MQSFLKHYQKQFNAIQTQTSELWSSMRKLALARFVDEGLPNTQTEAFRYIALSSLLKQPFIIKSVPYKKGLVEEVQRHLPAFNQTDRIRFLCINGHFYLPDDTLLPSGIKIDSFQEVVTDNPSRIIDKGFQHAHLLGHGLNALNTAFSEEGICLTIKDNIRINPIIEICYVSYQLSNIIQEPVMFCTRNDIRVGKNSSAQIIQYKLDIEDNNANRSSVCWNTLTTLTLASGSEVRWGQSTNIADHDLEIGQLACGQYQDSTFHTESLVNQGGLVRHTLAVDLWEKGACCKLYGLSSVKKEEQVDHQVIVRHQADHTQSEIHYRGIADERGRAAFNGEVIAREDIHHMHSHQGNYNLLLSNQAEINTKPRLALFSGDVQCSHGATVGALDRKALFYLRSRGLSEASARLLLIKAFSQSIWEAMTLLSSSDQLIFSDFLSFI